MLFSVIIPVYNVEKYLARCLDSFLKQDFNDYELILVDDGSTDNSSHIVDEYASKHKNIIVIHNENKGVSISREIGVRKSKGDYILFADSDDTVSDNYFAILSQNVGSDIIRFANTIVQDGKIKSVTKSIEHGVYDKEMIIKDIYPYLIQDIKNRYYCPSLWAHAFRRDLFIKNMLVNKKIRIGEDGACVYPCVYHASSITFLEDVLYNYYINDDSVTRSKKIYDWDYPLMIANHLMEKIDINEGDFKSQIDRKIVHELFHVVKSQFYRKEKTRDIKKSINENLDAVPLYVEAIQRAKFKSLSGKLLSYALRHRLLFLFKLMSKVR